MTSVTIGDGVTNIGDGAFIYCTELTDVKASKSVTSIGDEAFCGCENIPIITIPDGVTSIGDSSFDGCTGLKNVTIGNSVTSIGDSAFKNCSELTSITIPESVTNIERNAFGSCNKLEKVIFNNENKISLSIHLIDDSENASIYCKENSYIHAFAESNGLQFCICYDLNDSEFRIKNDILLSYTGSSDSLYISTVSKIGFGALAENTTLKSVELSNGVDRIYNQAFLNCSNLTKIIIPQSVASIGDNAFDGCDEVTVYCYSGSYAESYADAHNIPIEYINLKIEDSIVKLNLTETAQLKASYSIDITENDDLVWTSDNPSVVEVSPDGKITAVGSGTATITATSSSGLYATCVVNVTMPEVKKNVNSVSVNDISMNYKSSAKINPTIDADEGAEYTISYSSSNNKVATVDNNGNVYASGKGTATITCTITDTNGNTVTDNCNVTVKYTVLQWIIKIVLFGWIWY